MFGRISHALRFTDESLHRCLDGFELNVQRAVLLGLSGHFLGAFGKISLDLLCKDGAFGRGGAVVLRLELLEVGRVRSQLLVQLLVLFVLDVEDRLLALVLLDARDARRFGHAVCRPRRLHARVDSIHMLTANGRRAPAVLCDRTRSGRRRFCAHARTRAAAARRAACARRCHCARCLRTQRTQRAALRGRVVRPPLSRLLQLLRTQMVTVGGLQLTNLCERLLEKRSVEGDAAQLLLLLRSAHRLVQVAEAARTESQQMETPVCDFLLARRIVRSRRLTSR
mmetsp:Transcript_21618/g.47262  ORF Transcript_21618/g.47262 Transcript_21618/m.47262 type:complete len:282 (-) Transcript_21618:433-1278(-)